MSQYTKVVSINKKACLKKSVSYEKSTSNDCDMFINLSPYTILATRDVAGCILDRQMLTDETNERSLRQIENTIDLAKSIRVKKYNLSYPILIGCAILLFISIGKCRENYVPYKIQLYP